jgi:serine/threonine-protein kinase Chk2
LFDQIIEVGKYPEEKARKLLLQMLEAVEYLHNQGIAHRDLKPENILLKSKADQTIKLSDFGLSRIIGEGSFMKTLCGTPQYLGM